MKRLFALIIPAVLLLSCAPAPQTVEEFRTAINTQKSMFLKKYNEEVNRPFSKVYADLQKHAKKCMNFKVTTTTRRGYAVSTMTTYWGTVVEKTGKGKAYVSVQQHSVGVKNVTKEPEGGYYTMLVDIEAKGKNKTVLKGGGPNIGFGEWYDGITAAAKGEKYNKKKCPAVD